MSGYGQFCPVAKSMEVLGERWTLLIIRELCVDDQSFSSLRKGLPLISPTLLSSRLKSLERQGVLCRKKTTQGVSYSLTEAGKELMPVIEALGIWGQRWVRSKMTKKDLDPTLLMWDIHRRIDIKYFPEERRVVHFVFLDYGLDMRFWWLVVENAKVDICLKDPGYEPNLLVETDLRTLTRVWMGDTTIGKELRCKSVRVSGDPELKVSFPDWLGTNVFSDQMPAQPARVS